MKVVFSCGTSSFPRYTSVTQASIVDINPGFGIGYYPNVEAYELLFRRWGRKVVKMGALWQVMSTCETALFEAASIYCHV